MRSSKARDGAGVLVRRRTHAEALRVPGPGESLWFGEGSLERLLLRTRVIGKRGRLRLNKSGEPRSWGTAVVVVCRRRGVLVRVLRRGGVKRTRSRREPRSWGASSRGGSSSREACLSATSTKRWTFSKTRYRPGLTNGEEGHSWAGAARALATVTPVPNGVGHEDGLCGKARLRYFQLLQARWTGSGPGED